MDGGGALMNQSIHMFDILSWIMGDPELIQCESGTLGHDGIEVEDTAVVVFRYPGGAFGELEGTTAAYPGFFKRFEISGTGGSAIVEEDRIVQWDFSIEQASDPGIREEFGVGSFSRSSVVRFETEHAAHARQYQDFIGAIEAGHPPAVDGREALRAVRMVEAAYKSASIGRSVTKKLDHKGDIEWV
ncbi:MAG: Gfo/Idh/MocA family oxidoreductase [Spirochaetota bacterium]